MLLFELLNNCIYLRIEFSLFRLAKAHRSAKISRYNRLSGAAAAGSGGGRASGAAAASRQYNGRHDQEEEDDDAEAYFAYSSDDMLTSKVAGATNANESGPTAGYGSSQVAETSIPNFLLKLWKLVEDDRYNQCIEWDQVSALSNVRVYLVLIARSCTLSF